VVGSTKHGNEQAGCINFGGISCQAEGMLHAFNQCYNIIYFKCIHSLHNKTSTHHTVDSIFKAVNRY